MLAVRAGDLSRLAPLFERHHRPLFEYLARMTGSRTAAEDLVQEVFVRILKYRHTYRGTSRFSTWAFRIARNVRADYFRSRHMREETSLDETTELPTGEIGAAEALELDRQALRLRRALLLMREDQRELIVLVRYRGMKYEAIAELLGVEVGTVKTRIHRAVNELREIFLGLTEQSCSVKQHENGLLMV